jgi:riboflavin biosynthesis pyrimidine reductase
MVSEFFPQKGKTQQVTIDSPQSFSTWYPIVHGFRFNHVISNFERGGVSDQYSNELDRSLLKFIRSTSDLIISTGATAIAEQLNSSKYAPMLVLTKRDAIDFPAIQNESTKKIYLTQKIGTEYKNSNAIAIGTVAANVEQFSHEFCRLNSFNNVVLESGLVTARRFVAAHLLTEIDLTVTQAETSEQAEQIAEEFLEDLGVHQWKLIQLINWNETWFFRFDSSQANSK